MSGKSTRLQVIFVLITLVIDAMGIGLIMPVMPDLIREIEGATLADAAIWGGYLSFSFAIMQFLFGPTVGSLSDRYGRRPVLLISLFIMAVDYAVMALADTMWLLLLGRIIGGITAATHSTAAAFIADISSDEERSQNFGLVSAAFGVGFVLGPVIGGLLASFGPRAPFIAAAILAGSNFVFGYFVFPETVTDKIRRPFDWKRANPFGALMNIGRLPGIKPLLMVYFLYQVAFYVYPAIWSYFTQERFGWSPAMVGWSLAVFGISMAISQGLLIRKIIPWIGERKTVILGFALDIVVFFLTAILTNGWIVLGLTPLSALGGMATPAMQGLMSRAAGADQQGELQGLLTSIGALGMILSPLIMTRTFAMFSEDGAAYYLPGAPFLLSMVLMALGLGIYLAGWRKLIPTGEKT
ncbi:TCR/Tet family MFS transporter [Halocynthiibacter styelae]|uniref:TCR/Tet family MFS transporter n=1 Tax=Halocynthiibacter styelae TaxID=2761955 RepID=A0A8J7IEY7_9RHOB|nr:TCR/Tet family MFS transporter [Paenihalocynthiibacter styelae]MBI1494292.1 TCR/Tet family MFS transporter [Paenihalocynthiibacter styelae]